MKFLYPLFAATIFLSSFLLFQVQPLIGKHILPFYGGSSAVWVTAMFFFMVALAVGYVYALLLSKLRPLYQGAVHGLMILAASVSLYIHGAVWPSAITPEVSDITISFTDPVVAVFLTLLLTIGLPFALLSSTSSLLQLWYGELSGKEPFSLYSISNIGSLLGLLSYPILFEPFLTTYTQGWLWSIGVFFYALLLLSVLSVFVLGAKNTTTLPVTAAGQIAVSKVSPRSFFTWLLIAAVPVMVLLAGTSFMTSSIAPVPFLWVGPLALYLLSFIFTFREGGRPPMWANEIFVVLASILTLFLVVTTEARVFVTIVVTHLALFAISHWCHEHLYAKRPEARHVTLFYVALSLGGIAGSLIIKITSSYILVMPIELLIILVGSVAVIALNWFFAKTNPVPVLSKVQLRIVAVTVLCVVFASSTIYVSVKQSNMIAAERNFFGYKAVVDNTDRKPPVWSMQHGLTNHGYQVLEDGVPVVLPVSYYGESSGIGKAFSNLRTSGKEQSRIVIAGLGSGGLSAYCEPADDFTFIEIDEEVVSLAREHFTYLASCPNHTMIVNDGRLALEAERLAGDTRPYDLIILDAYADDMMPVHLMTAEAIETYKALLAEDGILAIHISSRYLNLLPVLKALAQETGLAARHFFDKEPTSALSTPSHWVLLSPQGDTLEKEAFAGMETFGEDVEPLLWTDTYSALLPIIRF